MKIRTKIALQFTLIIALILATFSASFYYIAEQNRKDEFYQNLRDRALTRADLLIKNEEINKKLLKIIDKETLSRLYADSVLMFNDKDQVVYSSYEADTVYYSGDLLKSVRQKRYVETVNGNLLVMGVMYTQRPDLFEAVVCQVPLLDMLRYHKLLAGNSWMGEYGNPDVPEEASYIRKYSPYQNVLPGKKYPKVFFMTSTKDDRVHPGHARKTAARMEEYGHPFLYYENTEGGHGAAANLEQRAKFYALMYTYLYEQLM